MPSNIRTSHPAQLPPGVYHDSKGQKRFAGNSNLATTKLLCFRWVGLGDWAIYIYIATLTAQALDLNMIRLFALRCIQILYMYMLTISFVFHVPLHKSCFFFLCFGVLYLWRLGSWKGMEIYNISFEIEWTWNALLRHLEPETTCSHYWIAWEMHGLRKIHSILSCSSKYTGAKLPN